MQFRFFQCKIHLVESLFEQLTILVISSFPFSFVHSSFQLGSASRSTIITERNKAISNALIVCALHTRYILSAVLFSVSTENTRSISLPASQMLL